MEPKRPQPRDHPARTADTNTTTAVCLQCGIRHAAMSDQYLPHRVASTGAGVTVVRGVPLKYGTASIPSMQTFIPSTAHAVLSLLRSGLIPLASAVLRFVTRSCPCGVSSGADSRRRAAQRTGASQPSGRAKPGRGTPRVNELTRRPCNTPAVPSDTYIRAYTTSVAIYALHPKIRCSCQREWRHQNEVWFFCN